MVQWLSVYSFLFCILNFFHLLLFILVSGHPFTLRRNGVSIILFDDSLWSKLFLFQQSFFCLGRDEAVEILVRKGANIGITNNEGKTPLDVISDKCSSYEKNVDKK